MTFCNVCQLHSSLCHGKVGSNMTLSIVIRGADGLVFATESRTTLDWPEPLPDGSKPTMFHDASHKLLTFKKPNNFVAAVTSGIGGIGNRSVYSFIPDIEAKIKGDMAVENFAKLLSNFFKAKWKATPELTELKNASMDFLIGGFNKKEPDSHVYGVSIPTQPKPIELQNGVFWIGQKEISHRLVKGYPILFPKIVSEKLSLNDEQVKSILNVLKPFELIFPWPGMGLQGYVDVAMLLIRTTIETQRLTVCKRECGGPIDVATITRKEGLHYVQVKEITAEL